MIYDLFELDGNGTSSQVAPLCLDEPPQKIEEVAEPLLKAKDRWFSAVAARLFFSLLLLADLVWLCVGIALLIIGIFGKVATCGKLSICTRLTVRMQLTVKRAAVCGVSLLMALFSPAFGIMIACTYFLMYDPKGIEEVVPQSLQAQFKEYFQK